MNAKLIIMAVLIALVTPAAMATIVPQFEIVRAEHRSGNCTYSDATKTHYTCELTYQDVTEKIQAVVNGNRVFKFDTRRARGGMFTEFGLAWQMPYQPGNLGFTTVMYRANGGALKQLAIRDRCWFNLGQNRVWCPPITILEGTTAETDGMFLV